MSNRATIKRSRNQRTLTLRNGRSAYGRSPSGGNKVILTRSEYERLLIKAGEAPAKPRADAQGNLPAVEFMRTSIARELIRRRTAAGLSQAELADRAGVRQETISRIESGKHTVTERTMARIEKALVRASA